MTTDNLIIPSAGTNTPVDRDKLKIASFRTKESVWADFTAAANSIGLTATDVIKAAMEQFIAGEYIPSINTSVGTTVSTEPNITRDEIQELINTAVSMAVSTSAGTAINTPISTGAIESSVMTEAIAEPAGIVSLTSPMITSSSSRPWRRTWRVRRPH